MEDMKNYRFHFLSFLACSALVSGFVPAVADTDTGLSFNTVLIASGADSANDADTVKSWTSENPPSDFDRKFLDSLSWEDHPLGVYILRTGKIYGKWVAAMQWTFGGKPVLTEYTPPAEYLEVIDPETGKPCSNVLARDVNNDGILEIAFVHKKLNDANYHMYSVYALTKKAPPKLLWKSGGELGDWLHKADRPGAVLWKGRARKD